MYGKEDLIRLVRQFLSRVEEAGINIEDAFIFGSYAQGQPHDYSDVDVALISDSFQGIRILDVDLIRRQLIDFVDLEVHPFNPSDFTENNPFARLIMQSGIRVQ